MIRIRNLLSLMACSWPEPLSWGRRLQPARATFEIRYSTDGGSTFSTAVSDGSAGDLNPGTGTIEVDVDGLLVTATTSGGTSSSLSTMDINVQSTGVNTPASSTTIIVQASMDNLLTAPPPLVLLNRFTDDSIPAVSTTAESWISTGNSLFTTSGASVVLDTLGIAPAIAPGFLAFGEFTAGSPYTVTEQVSVAPYAADTGLNIDNNDRIVSTPAPAGLLLVLSGLPMLGLGMWLHRRRNLTAA